MFETTILGTGRQLLSRTNFLPWGDPQIHVERRRVDFDSAVGTWDFHVDRCGSCLTQGVTLCYEGEYLTDVVVEAREAFGDVVGRIARPEVPFPIPRRTAGILDVGA